MITISLTTLLRAAETKPTGYLGDVVSQGEVVGGSVRFTNEVFEKLRAKYSAGNGPALAPGERLKSVEEARAVCQGCDKHMSGVCLSSKCGCAADRKRINPWETITRCPEGKW